MLVRYKDLKGRTIAAQDGDIGTVKDVLFDDSRWGVRYVVVDTSKWLPNRKVILSPVAFSMKPIEDDGRIRSHLKKSQIKAAPSLEHDLPVSRQFEERLHMFYGWSPWWGIPVTPTGPYRDVMAPVGRRQMWSKLVERRKRTFDGHLRSCEQVSGYKIRTADEKEFGSVKDFLIETKDFTITDLTMHSHRWIPGGREFVCSPMFVVGISWPGQVVEVCQDKETLMDIPEFKLDEYDKDYRKAMVEKYCRGPRSEGGGAGRYESIAGFR